MEDLALDGIERTPLRTRFEWSGCNEAGTVVLLQGGFIAAKMNFGSISGCDLMERDVKGVRF